MSFNSHLEWPFCEERRREFDEALALRAERDLRQRIDRRDAYL